MSAEPGLVRRIILGSHPRDESPTRERPIFRRRLGWHAPPRLGRVAGERSSRTSPWLRFRPSVFSGAGQRYPWFPFPRRDRGRFPAVERRSESTNHKAGGEFRLRDSQGTGYALHKVGQWWTSVRCNILILDRPRTRVGAYAPPKLRVARSNRARVTSLSSCCQVLMGDSMECGEGRCGRCVAVSQRGAIPRESLTERRPSTERAS